MNSKIVLQVPEAYSVSSTKNIRQARHLSVLYSHNTTIQIYRCREIQNTDNSPLFRYETFINFLTLVFRHKERDTIFTMLTVLSDPTNALRIPYPPKSLLIEICRTPWSDFNFNCLPLRQTNQLSPASSTVNSQLDWPGPDLNLNSRLFWNHQILSPSLLGMMSFTFQSHFLSGVFIMTFVIVISSARKRELYSMCVHLH